MIRIKHILQYMPIYILSSMNLPKGTLTLIEKYFANFFWGSSGDKKNFHLRSWKKLCYPKKEGGIGIRSMIEISDALAMKRWWRIRTIPSLWSQFLKAKYRSRCHPVGRKNASNISHIWRHVLHIRNKIEVNMLWRIHNRDCSF